MGNTNTGEKTSRTVSVAGSSQTEDKKWKKVLNKTFSGILTGTSETHPALKARKSETFALNLLTSIVIKKMINETGDLNYDAVAGWRRQQWQQICDDVNGQCDSSDKKLEDWKSARARFMRRSADNHDACVHQTFATSDPEHDDALTQSDVMKLRLRTDSADRVISQHLGKEPSLLTLDDLEKVGVSPDTTKLAQSFYLSTGFDTRYGVSEQEYDSLPPKAQQQVNTLRNLVWQFAHAFKSRGPPGSVERTFWTQGVVRKIVLLHISKLWYEHHVGEILEETHEFMEKMHSI